ncbi:MAG: YceI family protein [Bacteroidetes bacterium]|nr:YceI family protein [Bacteroidota bacterium]MBS1932455.1 YceI family protein [Bacteroidota bacterium]
MKKQLASLVICILLFAITVNAQDKFFTKKGKIYFDASAKMEKVEATNRAVISVIDIKSGNIQFAVMMKGFEFEKALMQEHFNENYVESDKFPKAEFIGQVTNNAEINYSKDGEYTAKVKGKMQMHGELKEVEATGIVIIKNGKIELRSEFSILLSDFKISIPALVKENISDQTKISVDCLMDPLKN